MSNTMGKKVVNIYLVAKVDQYNSIKIDLFIIRITNLFTPFIGDEIIIIPNNL